ncbi:MAG: RsmB/NOP family class I SAM-dependent RNA methyltransferase [Erysipelotrichaceae bacterium]|nr:RsmB/NOP family class I SAM-dependent RNA methyltransferase [Erysipelotrichaceae bacterium]
MELPESYLDSMRELLGEEYPDYLNCFRSDSIRSLRLNTRKSTVHDFLKINPFTLTPVSWSDDGFYYEETDDPTRHPYYYAGLYYIQEASAMLPAQLLPIEKGDRVLDLCAAPGGKTLKIADKLNGTGVLFANDISVSRTQVLLKNIENQGVTNCIVMAEEIDHLDRFTEYFDKILLDAPCSGEGMFRKDRKLIKSWLEKGSDCYAPIQKELLHKTVKLLKPGGKLVYSTCTFSRYENEEVIETALQEYPDLHVLPIKGNDAFVAGLTEKTRNCVRLYPHRIKGEGHFVALLQKGDTQTETDIVSDAHNNVFPYLEHFDIDLSHGYIVSRKDRFYLEPEIPVDLSGLRILRSGLYLGELSHDRFEPSYALAKAIKDKRYDNILNLSLEDQRVLKYLKGETLDVRDRHASGTVLVCVDHYPLGFGIVNKGILKNKLPAQYRYQ